MNVPPASARSNRPFVIGILILTLIGFGLRLFRLGNQSFWIDEVIAVIAAKGPLHGIYQRSVLERDAEGVVITPKPSVLRDRRQYRSVLLGEDAASKAARTRRRRRTASPIW